MPALLRNISSCANPADLVSSGKEPVIWSANKSSIFILSLQLPKEQKTKCRIAFCINFYDRTIKADLIKWKRIIFPFTRASFSSYTKPSMMLDKFHTISCVMRSKRHSTISRQAKFYVLSFSDRISLALNRGAGWRSRILSENFQIQKGVLKDADN